MAKIVKIGNLNIQCFTQKQLDRMFFPMGYNNNVWAQNKLRANQKLNKIITNDSVGALNNYAEHENLNIFLTPIENDMFDDMEVSVYKKNSFSKPKLSTFAVKLEEGKEGACNFLREIYTKVAECTKKQ